jgi:hypothetical protein
VIPPAKLDLKSLTTCAVGYATALHNITHIVLSYSRHNDPGGMSVRKTAAKFDVPKTCPKTVSAP